MYEYKEFERDFGRTVGDYGKVKQKQSDFTTPCYTSLKCITNMETCFGWVALTPRQVLLDGAPQRQKIVWKVFEN